MDRLCFYTFAMDHSGSNCMRSAHPGSPIWGCVRNHHTGVPNTGMPPYQQGSFSLHQKPEFLACTDFSGSCLVSTPHAYPREEHAYTESGGFQRADWQYTTCETQSRGQELCSSVAATVGGVNRGEMDCTGLDRLPVSVAGCLEGEYSRHMEKRTLKQKREIT
ncbi:hypothetical protein Z043_124375, partial [Scleropages formosus]